MKDIVERLRSGFDWDESASNTASLIQYGDLTNEAADEIESLRATLERSKQYHRMMELEKENFQLKEELETERIRLAACGVVALSNTEASATTARTMKDEYWSASCQDVANAVDREMLLRIVLNETYGKLGSIYSKGLYAETTLQKNPTQELAKYQQECAESKK